MKNLIVFLALAVFASCNLYAEVFNLRILKGYEDEKDLAGKILELKFFEDNGSVYMSMFAENHCVLLESSPKPAVCIKVKDYSQYSQFEKTLNIDGELVACYNFFNYSILDNRPSKCIVGFIKKNNGEYVLGVVDETFQGREPLFQTYLIAKLDDYATVSGLFKKYYGMLAVEPHNVTKSDDSYTMSSYCKGVISDVKIVGFAYFLGSYSFFLEVSDPHGTEDVSRLAKYLKENYEDGSASGTIVLVLDNDEKPVQLDHHSIVAKDDNTVSFNLTMDKYDFYRATSSNILALHTSGGYNIILGPDFQSSVTLKYMLLLQTFE